MVLDEFISEILLFQFVAEIFTKANLRKVKRELWLQNQLRHTCKLKLLQLQACLNVASRLVGASAPQAF